MLKKNIDIFIWLLLFLKRRTNKSTISSMVEWLKRLDCDRHGLGSKPTRAILLCPWKRF